MQKVRTVQNVTIMKGSPAGEPFLRAIGNRPYKTNEHLKNVGDGALDVPFFNVGSGRPVADPYKALVCEEKEPPME